MSQNIKVGISIGDINGIGVEVIMKSLEDTRILESITPVIYGSARIFSFYRKALNMPNFNYIKINKSTDAKDKQINLVNLWEEEIKISMGESTSEGGTYAFKSLKEATNDLASGKIDVLITAPINKKNIQSEEFNFPGHTEYLTKLSNAEDSLMFMIKENLRVGLVTNHVALNMIGKELTKDLILQKISIMNQSLLRDFGIVRPKIAVLGLNPHAGENGMIGDEENTIISPAIELAHKNGILAYGPYASDGLFGSGNYVNFDGILAMYHDQGLTPFKALAGGTGINYTAGLPIVRTSPDHGTAYEIAGQGIASEESFRNAIYLACDIFQNRKNYKMMTANPLVALEKEMER
jgi:4-hydroxythreonine-4-phosphate dehydrogenase